MKAFFLLLLVLMVAMPGVRGQVSATAVYNKSNQLIAVSDLSPQRDCGKQNVTGIISKVTSHNDSDSIYVDMKSGKREITFQIHPSVLSNVDRTNIFYNLLKKKARVMIEGYTCGSNGVIDAIAVKLRR